MTTLSLAADAKSDDIVVLYTNDVHCALSDKLGYAGLAAYKKAMYIRDCTDPVSADCRDAVEFQPALIVDGKILVDSNCGWTGLQPRACIGQSDKYEVLMLVIEGRNYAAGILGTDVIVCSNILRQHNCMPLIRTVLPARPSVSPVRTEASLVNTPMSPQQTLEVLVLSLPLGKNM